MTAKTNGMKGGERQKSLNVLSCNKLINRKVKNHFCVLLSNKNIHTHIHIHREGFTHVSWYPGGVWRAGPLPTSRHPQTTTSALKAFRIAHTTRCTKRRPRPICSLFFFVVFFIRMGIGLCVCVCVRVADNTQSFDFVPSQPLWQLSLLANISVRVFKRRITTPCPTYSPSHHSPPCQLPTAIFPDGNLSVFKLPLYPVEK